MQAGEKTSDLRVKRTRRAIRDAFHDLVLETHPDKITVKSITDKAGINRKTFYLHYPSIESLLDEEIDDILDRFFSEVEQTPDEPRDIEGHAKRFFFYLSGLDEYATKLICTRSYYDFGGKLYREQMARYKQAGNPFAWLGEKQPLVLHFIRSSALQFFRGWVRMGRTIEVHEAADLLASLTMNGVEPLMRD